MHTNETIAPGATGFESQPVLEGLRVYRLHSNGSELDKVRSVVRATQRYTVDECAALAKSHGANQHLLDAIARIKREFA